MFSVSVSFPELAVVLVENGGKTGNGMNYWKYLFSSKCDCGYSRVLKHISRKNSLHCSIVRLLHRDWFAKEARFFARFCSLMSS